jgi:hypothetical protein
VPAAQRLAGLADGVDGLRDLVAVLGVLVREHQLSGGCDRAGLIAVHALHLLGPFPAFIVEVETKRSDAFRRDRRLLERSVQGICTLTPTIAAQRTSAPSVAAPFVRMLWDGERPD